MRGVSRRFRGDVECPLGLLPSRVTVLARGRAGRDLPRRVLVVEADIPPGSTG